MNSSLRYRDRGPGCTMWRLGVCVFISGAYRSGGTICSNVEQKQTRDTTDNGPSIHRSTFLVAQH